MVLSPVAQRCAAPYRRAQAAKTYFPNWAGGGPTCSVLSQKGTKQTTNGAHTGLGLGLGSLALEEKTRKSNATRHAGKKIKNEKKQKTQKRKSNETRNKSNLNYNLQMSIVFHFSFPFGLRYLFEFLFHMLYFFLFFTFLFYFFFHFYFSLFSTFHSKK